MYLKQNCFKTESHYAALASSEPAYCLDQADLKLRAISLPLPSECITGMYHHLPTQDNNEIKSFIIFVDYTRNT